MAAETTWDRVAFGFFVLLLHAAMIAIYAGTAWYSSHTDGLVTLGQPSVAAESAQLAYYNMLNMMNMNMSGMNMSGMNMNVSSPFATAESHGGLDCSDLADKTLCSDLFNNDYDSMFQDVHIMTFIGFGFLMTFLKKYAYSAVAVNLLVAAFSCEWSALLFGYFWPHYGGWRPAMMDLDVMINADFTACTVLISMGAVLGKTTPLQLLIMALIECVLAQVNQYIGLKLLGATDVGGSMMIHAFGAYFGLSVATVLHLRRRRPESSLEKPSYTNDLFSMVGTVFLWLCWPSFNGALAHGTGRGRAILNTYLSLIGATVVVFALSSLTNLDNKEHKARGRLEMMHIQNATLAGGVAMGTAANLMVSPWAALLIGSIAGFISLMGYKYMMPRMIACGIHDTCGVNNLHGMPGFFGALVGVLFSGIASFQYYGYSLYTAFPAMAPPAGTLAYNVTYSITDGSISPGEGRLASQQAGMQMATLMITMGIAIVGGYITGGILRIPRIWGKTVSEEEELYADDMNFVMPEDYESWPTAAADNGMQTVVVANVPKLEC